MTLLMLAMPVIAKAQFGFDVGSVEAYISDHKNQRSLLLARATLEQSNNLLHEYSAKAAVRGGCAASEPCRRKMHTVVWHRHSLHK